MNLWLILIIIKMVWLKDSYKRDVTHFIIYHFNNQEKNYEN